MIDVSLQSCALTERTGTRMFFHGGKNAVRAIDPDTFGPDGELLCGSASPNVALRYGPIITRLTVARWTSMTLQEFWANTTSFETLRARGIGAVVVTGDPQMFDFPVDTVFILDSASTRCEPNGCDVDSLAQQLDGLPQREPAGPSEPGWDLYLASVYGGDLDDLLTTSAGRSALTTGNCRSSRLETCAPLSASSPKKAKADILRNTIAAPTSPLTRHSPMRSSRSTSHDALIWQTRR